MSLSEPELSLPARHFAEGIHHLTSQQGFCFSGL